MSTLPTDPKERKQRPIASGVLDYFPDALAEVAYCSWVGNEQHNPGQHLHWAKEKSTDEPDALIRHLIQRGTYDTDGVRHSAKVAWRALAMLQREIDAEVAAKLAQDLERLGVGRAATVRKAVSGCDPRAAVDARLSKVGTDSTALDSGISAMVNS